MATNSKSFSNAVLLTDGNERSTLAVTRALGQRGLSVYVGAETPISLAGSSRYCTRTFVYPSPLTDPEAYVSSLIEAIGRWKANVLFPMTDLAVELIGEYRDQLGPDVTVPIPSMEQYHQLSNKYELTKWGQEQGVPIPRTHFVPDGTVTNVIDRITTWPVVVKPGRSLVKIDGAWKKTGVSYAQNADDLLRLYAEVQYLRHPSLIQERIIGEGQGVFGLFDRGKPLTLFAHRRLREKPPSGGVSVLRESIALPEPMTSYAMKIAQSVDWQGVMMVEFKVDRDTQVPYLMEVNGRFWGSLQLAVDAGVDFPWLLYQQTTGLPLDGVKGPYRVGIKSRWWLGDLDHLFLRLWKADAELNLPSGSPSRLETLKDFFSVLDPSTKSEVFRVRDPRPGVHEIGIYVLPLIRRAMFALYNRLLAARFAVMRAAWAVGLGLGVHKRRIGNVFSRPIGTVLVLCKGNVCRSPFAARYLEMQFDKHHMSIEVVSAGLDTTAGEPAYPLAITTSVKYSIDLSRHQTNVISRDLVAKADLILVMELVHNQMLLRMFPEARSKTLLLGHFSSSPLTEIHDPYGKNPEEFHRCYAVMVKACEGLVGLLNPRQ